MPSFILANVHVDGIHHRPASSFSVLILIGAHPCWCPSSAVFINVSVHSRCCPSPSVVTVIVSVKTQRSPSVFIVGVQSLAAFTFGVQCSVSVIVTVAHRRSFLPPSVSTVIADVYLQRSPLVSIASVHSYKQRTTSVFNFGVHPRCTHSLSVFTSMFIVGVHSQC